MVARAARTRPTVMSSSRLLEAVQLCLLLLVTGERMVLCVRWSAVSAPPLFTEATKLAKRVVVYFAVYAKRLFLTDQRVWLLRLVYMYIAIYHLLHESPGQELNLAISCIYFSTQNS